MQMIPAFFKLRIEYYCPNPSTSIFQDFSGSASQFIVSSVFNHSLSSQLNHLVILRDAEEAAYFHNTLENITKALDIFYFPSSFKNKKNYSLLNSSHVMLRTEALTKIIRRRIIEKLLSLTPKQCLKKLCYQKHFQKILFLLNRAKR